MRKEAHDRSVEVFEGGPGASTTDSADLLVALDVSPVAHPETDIGMKEGFLVRAHLGEQGAVGVQYRLALPDATTVVKDGERLDEVGVGDVRRVVVVRCPLAQRGQGLPFRRFAQPASVKKGDDCEPVGDGRAGPETAVSLAGRDREEIGSRRRRASASYQLDEQPLLVVCSSVGPTVEAERGAA